MFESSRALFFGALTFGIASVAYVIYGPSPSSKKKSGKGSVLGLVNYGNHCFVNAVLQSLAACKSLVNWLQYAENNSDDHKRCFLGKQNNYCSTPRIIEPQNKLTTCLLKTLRLLNNAENNNQHWTPMEVLDALVSHNYTIPNEEQDAHELFNILTTTLEREFYSSLPLYSLRDALLVEDLLQSPVSPGSSPRISTRGSKSVSGSRNPVSLPTRGLLASQMQCQVCGHKYPVRLDTFNSVTLAIPNKILGGPILLQECLQKFISSEVIPEVTCDECNITKKVQESKSSFVKKLTFGKLPQLLCFHFQRLMWLNNGMPMKRSEHINFPEFLNMDEYVYTSMKPKPDVGDQYSSITGLLGGTAATQISPKDFTFPISSVNTPQMMAARYRYRLSSVIVHYGDALSGHFITYRRGGIEDNDKWYFASDSQVKRVPLLEVMSSSAYMLFYERIK